jgi:hypothetical protein
MALLPIILVLALGQSPTEKIAGSLGAATGRR